MAKSPSTKAPEKAVIASIRTTAEIKNSIKEKARQAQMAVGDYILACALNRVIPVLPSELNTEAYGQLMRQSVSLDELTSLLKDLQQNPFRQSEEIQPLVCALIDRIAQQQQLMNEVRELLLYGKDNQSEDATPVLDDGFNPTELEI